MTEILKRNLRDHGINDHFQVCYDIGSNYPGQKKLAGSDKKIHCWDDGEVEKLV